LDAAPTPAFDNNLRRKKILIKYTMMVFLAYAITQIATYAAYRWGLSSIRLSEIVMVGSPALALSLLFLGMVHVKRTISVGFANLVFFGQFAVWLVMYPIWFLTLREIRSMALFCALMALSFLLSHARLSQSVLITATATLIQLAGSYYAIFHLDQPGDYRREVFYTLCFLPCALFICHLSGQFAAQRAEVKAAKRSAEQSRDALQAESERASRLNAELQDALRAIQENAIRDVLTGLYNRRHLQERLETEKKRADRSGTIFSVIVLDIDHFKRVNDTFGHLKGDDVLKAVAQVIQAGLRETDLCARFGGEEFVIVLEQTHANTALICAERVRQLVERAPVPSIGADFHVTVSLGVSAYQPIEDIAQTIARADEALYRAKRAGRNRVAEGRTGA
jgi:diguanylate cyclase (GGDEF)-like protein